MDTWPAPGRRGPSKGRGHHQRRLRALLCWHFRLWPVLAFPVPKWSWLSGFYGCQGSAIFFGKIEVVCLCFGSSIDPGLSLQKVNFLHFHWFFLALCNTIIIVILGFLVFAGF